MDVLNSAYAHEQILKALATSATYGADASPLIREDLEAEAANQLYSDTSPIEMVLLKDMPRKPATNVVHQYTQVNAYGNERTEGFFPESGLPTYSNQQFTRKTVNIKLMGEWAAVNLIAQLENNIRAIGQTDLVGTENAAKMLLLQHKVTRNLYFADAAATTTGLRFDGLYALIRDNSPADHIIDLRGKKLTPDDVRSAAKKIALNHGVMTGLYLSLDDKEQLEKQLDAAERLYLNQRDNAQVVIGQNIDGMYTQGGSVYFRPDNTLSPIHANFYLPSSPYPDDVPTALTTVTATPRAAAGAEVSQWAASDAAADIAYHVTALNATGEGPALAVTPAAVDVDEVVELSITPRATDKSFRVYRGSATLGITPALIKEIPHTAGDTTPITFVDENDMIPGTRFAFGLNLQSQNFRKFGGDATMNNLPKPQNTVSIVQLTAMSVFTELAKLGLLASNDVIFWPLVLEMTHPKQNVVFINVGNN